jgi:hypothetical protein
MISTTYTVIIHSGNPGVDLNVSEIWWMARLGQQFQILPEASKAPRGLGSRARIRQQEGPLRQPP